MKQILLKNKRIISNSELFSQDEEKNRKEEVLDGTRHANSKIKILHLEDSARDAELIERELRKGNFLFEKKVVDNKESFEKMLCDFKPDIILSDHSLTSFDSFGALAILKEKKLDIPFVLITATVSEEFAVEIMKQGASDYVLKDRLQRLPSAITNSIEMHRLAMEKQSAVERLSFHIKNGPLGFIEWDNRGFAKSLSTHAEDILGWSEKEFIENQETGFGIIHEQDLHWVSKITGQMIRGEVERNKMKYRNITKDGRVVWCECFNSVLKDKNGNVKTIMSLVQDITEQKEMEGQRNNFLSVASHELNTPVTTIKAYGQLAESILLKKGDAETLNVIKRMGTQVNRLSILIGNLLDFTKIQKGKLKYNEDFFNFNDLVKEVIDDMQKISLTHKIKRNRGKSAQFFGDKDKIGQVLTNLISNAIKFSRNADSIFVNTKLQKNVIQISVQDYGIGISTKNRENVFQQFYRVTTSGDSHKTFPGMGIGLYVCSDIIARVGGKLWVESVIDKGSTFFVLLPLDHRNANM